MLHWNGSYVLLLNVIHPLMNHTDGVFEFLYVQAVLFVKDYSVHVTFTHTHGNCWGDPFINIGIVHFKIVQTNSQFGFSTKHINKTVHDCDPCNNRNANTLLLGGADVCRETTTRTIAKSRLTSKRPRGVHISNSHPHFGVCTKSPYTFVIHIILAPTNEINIVVQSANSRAVFHIGHLHDRVPCAIFRVVI